MRRVHATTTLTPYTTLFRSNDQGKLKDAETMYQQALAGFEKTLGPDHKSTLDTVNKLGDLYRDQDKLGKADVLNQGTLAGRVQSPAPIHESTLWTVSYLGDL